MTPADPRRIRLVSEAVVSSYINDISTRTRAGVAAPERARADGVEPAPTVRADQRRRWPSGILRNFGKIPSQAPA